MVQLPWGAAPKYAMINGSLMISNTGSATKRYFMIVGGVSKSAASLPGRIRNIGGLWGENVISAFAVQ